MPVAIDQGRSALQELQKGGGEGTGPCTHTLHEHSGVQADVRTPASEVCLARSLLLCC